jgi:hypothetical protein
MAPTLRPHPRALQLFRFVRLAFEVQRAPAETHVTASLRREGHEAHRTRFAEQLDRRLPNPWLVKDRDIKVDSVRELELIPLFEERDARSGFAVHGECTVAGADHEQADLVAARQDRLQDDRAANRCVGKAGNARIVAAVQLQAHGLVRELEFAGRASGCDCSQMRCARVFGWTQRLVKQMEVMHVCHLLRLHTELMALHGIIAGKIFTTLATVERCCAEDNLAERDNFPVNF